MLKHITRGQIESKALASDFLFGDEEGAGGVTTEGSILTAKNAAIAVVVSLVIGGAIALAAGGAGGFISGNAVADTTQFPTQ